MKTIKIFNHGLYRLPKRQRGPTSEDSANRIKEIILLESGTRGWVGIMHDACESLGGFEVGYACPPFPSNPIYQL